MIVARMKGSSVRVNRRLGLRPAGIILFHAIIVWHLHFPHPGSSLMMLRIGQRMTWRRPKPYQSAMADRIKAVVLAAGKSTRMSPTFPRCCTPFPRQGDHPLPAGQPARVRLAAEDIVIVAGDNRAEIGRRSAADSLLPCRKSRWARPRLLSAADEHVAAHDGGLLVLVGDNPMSPIPSCGR